MPPFAPGGASPGDVGARSVLSVDGGNSGLVSERPPEDLWQQSNGGLGASHGLLLAQRRRVSVLMNLSK